MYSVILMAAMATNGPDAVAFGGRWRAGCTGCYGCSGYSCGGCYGCSGCYGCGGCYGGWSRGGCFGLHGCYGVVSYGVSGYGCNYCSCFGVYGGTACYGGCYGSCMGCTGHYYSGCYGGCYGTPIWYGYGPAMPGQQPPAQDGNNPMAPPAVKPEAPKADAPKAGGAKLIIDAPTDAALFIDDLPFRAETGRQFSTPALTPGQTYYYTVRVEMSRDGKPVSETRRVLVRANETVRESFGTPATSTMVAKESR